jgi:hypothetical protein
MMFTYSTMPVETLRQKSQDIQTHIREVGITGIRLDQLNRELAHLEFEIAYQLGRVAQLFGISMPNTIIAEFTAA